MRAGGYYVWHYMYFELKLLSLYDHKSSMWSSFPAWVYILWLHQSQRMARVSLLYRFVEFSSVLFVRYISVIFFWLVWDIFGGEVGCLLPLALYKFSWCWGWYREVRPCDGACLNTVQFEINEALASWLINVCGGE